MIEQNRIKMITAEKKEMRIIGKSIRTTNANGKSLKDQPEFWQKFFTEQIGEKILNKVNPMEILGVYSDYESDYTGAYTFTIGFEVHEDITIPEGFSEIKIPASRYSVFSLSENSGLGEKVGKLWSSIWNSEIKRNYFFDFEVYNISSMMADNPNVSIYIGIK